MKPDGSKTIQEAMKQREEDRVTAEKWVAFYKEAYPDGWLDAIKNDYGWVRFVVWKTIADEGEYKNTYDVLFTTRDFSIYNKEYNERQFKVFKEKFPASEGYKIVIHEVHQHKVVIIHDDFAD